MKAALDLPADHKVGSWVYYGGRDGRGGLNKETWAAAVYIEGKYYDEHSDLMPLRQLQREISRSTGQKAYLTSLRAWRNQAEYRRSAGLPMLPDTKPVALSIEREYYERKKKLISLKDLQSDLFQQTRQKLTLKTLNAWRQDPDYRQNAGLPPLEAGSK